ncbi:hypothetical protein GCM10010837_05800 [Aminobacter niigataensis]
MAFIGLDGAISAIGLVSGVGTVSSSIRGAAIATCTGSSVTIVAGMGGATKIPACGIGADMACWTGMEGAAAAMSACGTGLAGRATEAVVSFDGPDDMMSLSPMLEVQPAKARLARTIADAAEKRIGTRTQEQLGSEADSPPLPH